ncbi:hypothetical protein CLOM_g23907 [Closterium sp. NIES-68]|nr:hypothetical protein CLOM_g23907 [Closterium sp. NIES-68]GJP58724.1 hypothetical protein CLOP_g3313 [Closterium sp. NIES-67]
MAPATPSSARSAAADGAAATSTAMPAAPASHARRAAEPDSAAAAQASHSSTSWVDGSTSEAAGGRREPAAAAAPPKESCIKHMDAIWFCYSPVYQTTQYYREGAFDSCVGKWGDLWDCMLLRTAAAPAVMVSAPCWTTLLTVWAAPCCCWAPVVRVL